MQCDETSDTSKRRERPAEASGHASWSLREKRIQFRCEVKDRQKFVTAYTDGKFIS
jgi:hypothetical protein